MDIGADANRLHHRGTQQINSQAGWLEVGLAAYLLRGAGKETADGVAADNLAPRPSGKMRRNEAVAVDVEERFMGWGHRVTITMGVRELRAA